MHHAEANFICFFVGQVALDLDILVLAFCHLTCDILAVANLLYIFTTVCHGMWFFTAPHRACLASVSNPAFKRKHSNQLPQQRISHLSHLFCVVSCADWLSVKVVKVQIAVDDHDHFWNWVLHLSHYVFKLFHVCGVNTSNLFITST